MMHRRAFLSYVSGAAAGLALAGCRSNESADGAPQAPPAPTDTPAAATQGANPGATAEPTSTTSATPQVARTGGPPLLIVAHMAGGNDGLNTVIPVGNGRYHDLRPDLALTTEAVREFAGAPNVGWHPSMAPLEPLWNAGQLAAVHSVGLPDATRSHFVASDAWWAATVDQSTSGWLGRWLRARQVDDPLAAVSMGRGAEVINAPGQPVTSILSPSDFGFVVPENLNAEQLVAAYLEMARLPSADPMVASFQDAITGTAEASALFAGLEVVASANSYGPSNFVQLLSVAADLVVADPTIQVINVGVTGFDTHATQERLHAELLGDLASGIAQFFLAAEAGGFADRTVLVTSSEFGRRAAGNGSTGTDHGKGSVHFVCGPQVAQSTVIGLPDLSSLDDGDVPNEFDIRSIYAEALDWLDGPADEVLGATYPRLDLLG